METRKELTQKEISIAKRIKRLRKQKGITQEQLAEKIQVSTTHIGMVEIGKRRLSLRKLQKVANVLGVKVNDLIPF